MRLRIWWEVVSTSERCYISGTVESPTKPYRENEGDNSFDYFDTKEKAREFVRGF